MTDRFIDAVTRGKSLLGAVRDALVRANAGHGTLAELVAMDEASEAVGHAVEAAREAHRVATRNQDRTAGWDLVVKATKLQGMVDRRLKTLKALDRATV